MADTGKRPISPHLQVYRWSPAMLVSILHRVTGSILAVGAFLLTWWLVALATGTDYFNVVNGLAATVLGRLVLFGVTWALMQHLASGIRHLFMDMGHGFKPHVSATWARMTLVLSLAATILIWVGGYMSMGRM